MTTKVAANTLGEEWTGYVVPVSGGNKQARFSHEARLLDSRKGCLLLSMGCSCVVDQGKLNRKYKSVWVFTVDANLNVLNVVMWLLF